MEEVGVVTSALEVGKLFVVVEEGTETDNGDWIVGKVARNVECSDGL